MAWCGRVKRRDWCTEGDQKAERFVLSKMDDGKLCSDGSFVDGREIDVACEEERRESLQKGIVLEIITKSAHDELLKEAERPQRQFPT